jgi:pyridoxal phosphate enzyme (YggS family)
MNEISKHIALNLAEIEAEIEKACIYSGRKREEITLVGVSKTHPIEKLHAAFEAGLRHFGENKAQELHDKASVQLGHQQGGETIWHFIGHLQRNKAKEIVRFVDLLHSLDSLRLAEALNRMCETEGRILDCLVQVNISHEDTKSGVEPADLMALLAELKSLKSLNIKGLMGIASPTEDEEELRKEFRNLRTLRDEALSQQLLSGAALSMGMSSDMVIAIEEGATHIRVGSAIFGERTYNL